MASESVTTFTLNNEDFCQTPGEVAFLHAWRGADDVGKLRMRKALIAGVAGRLPPVEVVEAMTDAERRAFLDALPEPG